MNGRRRIAQAKAIGKWKVTQRPDMEQFFCGVPQWSTRHRENRTGLVARLVLIDEFRLRKEGVFLCIPLLQCVAVDPKILEAAIQS